MKKCYTGGVSSPTEELGRGGEDARWADVCESVLARLESLGFATAGVHCGPGGILIESRAVLQAMEDRGGAARREIEAFLAKIQWSWRKRRGLLLFRPAASVPLPRATRKGRRRLVDLWRAVMDI